MILSQHVKHKVWTSISNIILYTINIPILGWNACKVLKISLNLLSLLFIWTTSSPAKRIPSAVLVQSCARSFMDKYRWVLSDSLFLPAKAKYSYLSQVAPNLVP